MTYSDMKYGLMQLNLTNKKILHDWNLLSPPVHLCYMYTL